MCLFLGSGEFLLLACGPLFPLAYNFSMGTGSVVTLVTLPGAHLVLQAFGKTCAPRSLRFSPQSRPFGGGFFCDHTSILLNPGLTTEATISTSKRTPPLAIGVTKSLPEVTWFRLPKSLHSRAKKEASFGIS